MSRIDDLVRDYRLLLLARNNSLVRDYTRRWYAIEQRLNASYLGVAQEIAALEAAGIVPNPARIYELPQFRALLEQARQEISRFDRYVSGAIEQEQYLAWADGIEYAAENIKQTYLANQMTAVTVPILDVERVRVMLGLTQTGTPLYNLLNESYPETVTTLVSLLEDAMVQGWNPRVTARKMADAMAGNLQRAFTISRTEQMRAHRIATVQQYRTSQVVIRYRRRANLRGETCLACLLQDGKVYELYEQFSDHPRGGCTCFAEMDGVPLPNVPSGRNYLLALDRERQIRLMGEARYQAWVDGTVALDDMSRIHNHTVWGESPQIVPLKNLLPTNEVPV